MQLSQIQSNYLHHRYVKKVGCTIKRGWSIILKPNRRNEIVIYNVRDRIINNMVLEELNELNNNKL